MNCGFWLALGLAFRGGVVESENNYWVMAVRGQIYVFFGSSE